MKLLLLRCPACQRPLKANDHDLVLLCPACFAAVAIQDDGLSLTKIQFAQSRSSPAEPVEWRPYWIFNGQVTLHSREVQSKDGFFSNNSAAEAEKLWGQTRRLYVPAWELSLAAVQEIGCRLIMAQPDYVPVAQPAAPNLLPAILSAADGQKMLEFIVTAIEARRPDMLRSLQFSIQINDVALWALPE
jgi:hypothetical protein